MDHDTSHTIGPSTAPAPALGPEATSAPEGLSGSG